MTRPKQPRQELNLKQILTTKGRRDILPKGLLPPDVRRARDAEKRRRVIDSHRLVGTALERLYPEVADILHRQAQDLVAEKRGPLPGDEIIERYQQGLIVMSDE